MLDAGRMEIIMKITVNATIEMELTTEEVMAICQNSAAKKKVTEAVKTQVKQSLKTAGLESLNKTLIELEHNDDYLAHLTWEQMSTHKEQLWKLCKDEVISDEEWSERSNFIGNKWYANSKSIVESDTESMFEHLMGDDEIEEEPTSFSEKGEVVLENIM